MKLLIGAWLCNMHIEELMQSGIKPIRKTEDKSFTHECQEKDCVAFATAYLNFIIELNKPIDLLERGV